MSIEIKVPALGESITEATVAKWLKSEGESFKIDEKEAAKTILSSLKSGRPRSEFKPIIYRDIQDLMKRRKLSKK